MSVVILPLIPLGFASATKSMMIDEISKNIKETHLHILEPQFVHKKEKIMWHMNDQFHAQTSVCKFRFVAFTDLLQDGSSWLSFRVEITFRSSLKVFTEYTSRKT